MRVATSSQMGAVDRETIAGGVAGIDLMETAGREMTWEVLRLHPGLQHGDAVAVCCGKGNNGGDGLVMARLLEGLGFNVTVMLLAEPDGLSDEARTNYDRLPPGVEVLIPPREAWADRWSALCGESDLVIDAVFGTGIKPPVDQDHAALFEAFNSGGAPVVSVDIPSGVSGENGVVSPNAVRADTTITVGLPKLGLLVHPGRDHVGDLSVVDIGFEPELCEKHTRPWEYLLPEDYALLLPDRPGDVHKYRCGTLLILAGSRRYGGAAILAGMGALRSGAGLVTMALPEVHCQAALAALPEVPQIPLPCKESGGMSPLDREAMAELLTRQSAVAIGPGIGADPDTDRCLIDLLGGLNLPVVVDADAISAFARQGSKPEFASEQVVLTPHAGELARLAGIDSFALNERRLELVPELAGKWGVTLVAKGAPTLIGHPDGTMTINPNGDDCLAHGGTGDVLTGLIGGLLGQGCSADAAAQLGCWLHGRAGEMATAEVGSRRSVSAADVASFLGEAYAELEALAVYGGAR